MDPTSASPGAPTGAVLRDPVRLAAVRSDGLVDSASEERFDRTARLACRILRTSWAFVTFVDERKVHYKSVFGRRVPEISTHAPVCESFCAYVVDGQQPLLVTDTRLDSRFSGYRCVADGPFRSYAGAPVMVDDLCLGTVCVIDDQPRSWSEDDVQTLVTLGATVASEVRLQRQSMQLRRSQEWVARQQRTLQLAMNGAAINSFDWDILHNHVAWSEKLEAVLRIAPGSFSGTFEAFEAMVHEEDRWRVKQALERAFAGTDDEYECTFRMWRGDGTLRCVRAHGFVERDAAGTPTRLFGVDVDIGERRTESPSRSELVEHKEHLHTRIADLTQDIDARREAEASLQADNRELTLLTRIARLLILEGPADGRSMEPVFAEIARMIGMEAFYHYRVSNEPGVLTLNSAGGISDEERRLFATVRVGVHLCGRVADSGAPVIIEDLQASSAADARILAAHGAMSYAGFPLIARGKVLGTLAYVSQARRRLDDAQLQLMQGICDQVAAILEREDLLEALRSAHGALSQQESQLRMAIQASHSVVFEWDIVRDRVRRMVSAHPALPETREQPARFEDVVQAVHPEDREIFRHNVQSALDATTDTYTSEHRVQDAHGRITWVMETGRVERDADGRPLRMLGVAQDVTERKEAVWKLQASRAFSRQVTDVVPAILYVYDLAERRNVWGNREMIAGLGYTREQVDALAGSILEQLVHGEDWPRYLKHAARLMQLRDGDVAEFEYRVRKADGSWCWLYSRDMVFNRASDGSPRQVVGAAVDITARKEAEARLNELTAELRHEHARKDQFLAMLAHELRNPLAPLRNVSHVLGRAAGQDAAVGKVRGVIERQVRILARLVDDLLDVSRVANGKLTLERAPLDLAVVVRQAVEIARPILDSKGHELTLTMPPDGVLCVDGDATRLTQVVSNLLNNAAKYTQGSGFIAVFGELELDKVVLRVMDNGSGIAPDLLPHIFDLYAQVDRSLEHSQGGLGIGLALVKSLVSLHGGEVGVQSTPGRGSTFTVRLPRSPVRCLPAQETMQVANASSRRILVVDDNADAAETLSILLRLAGHEVHREHHPDAALAMVVGYRPDVCILDIGLPGMSGLELAGRLRGLPETRNALLIAVSGYGKPEDKAQAEAAGFEVHMTKPIDPNRLLDLLSRPHAGTSRT